MMIIAECGWWWCCVPVSLYTVHSPVCQPLNLGHLLNISTQIDSCGFGWCVFSVVCYIVMRDVCVTDARDEVRDSRVVCV